MHIRCLGRSSRSGSTPCPPGRWTAAAPAPRSPTSEVRHAPAPIPSAPRWRLPHGSCVLQLLPAPPPALHDRCKHRLLHPAIGLRMRLFQRVIHVARVQIIILPNFQQYQHFQIIFFVHFTRIYVYFSLLAGCCSGSMFQRTSRPSLLPPCHSWPLQQYLSIPSPGTKPDCCSR